MIMVHGTPNYLGIFCVSSAYFLKYNIMVEEFTVKYFNYLGKFIHYCSLHLLLCVCSMELFIKDGRKYKNIFLKKEAKFVLSERSSFPRIFVQILSWVVSRNFSGIWGSILGKCHFLVVFFFYKKDIFFPNLKNGPSIWI